MVTDSRPSRRDFAAEYRTARVAKHRATTLADQLDAEKLARRIDAAAQRKGVCLDVIGLDEQAREFALRRCCGC